MRPYRHSGYPERDMFNLNILFYNIITMENKNPLYSLKEGQAIDYNIAPYTTKRFFRPDTARKIKSFIISYSSPFNSGIAVNDRVYSELFIPDKKNGNSGVIILLHGFTSKLHSLKHYYGFISRAVEKHHPCLLINLPFHLHRTPPGERSGQRLIQNRDNETLDFFNQAVMDIKRGIHIINKLFSEDSRFKKNPFGKIDFSICGLSLGGMISVVAMAWEKSIRKGVLIQCGGNWDTIYWNSLVRVIMHGCFIDREKIKREQG